MITSFLRAAMNCSSLYKYEKLVNFELQHHAMQTNIDQKKELQNTGQLSFPLSSTKKPKILLHMMADQPDAF